MKKFFGFLPVFIFILIGCQKQKSPNYVELGEILFSVDTSQKENIDKGVYDFRDFDIDSKGNIFILIPQTDSDWIYKYDSSGNFVRFFARKGQGPGEMLIPRRININEDDLLTVDDPARRSLLIFNNSGKFMRSYKLPSGIRHADLLKNGCFLTTKRRVDPENEGYSYFVLTLCDENFNTYKELAVYPLPPRSPEVLSAKISSYYWEVINNKIYYGSDEEGYEIKIFDLNGNLLNTVSKKYTPVKYWEGMKKAELERFEKIREAYGNPAMTIYFPKHMPPFHSFFINDDGYLFVRTFEKKEEETVHDIFDPEGKFTGRLVMDSFGKYGTGLYTYARAQNGRVCYLREKEGGYKELVCAELSVPSRIK